MAKAENTRPSCVLLRLRSALTSGATVAMLTLSTYRMKYMAQSSPKTIPGALSRFMRTNDYLRGTESVEGFSANGSVERSPSCARPGFAFNLGAMHDSARGRVKGIAAMHGATVIPKNQVSDAPFVVPGKLLASHVGPQLIEQRFRLGQGQAVYVRVASAAKIEHSSVGFRMRAHQGVVRARRSEGVVGGSDALSQISAAVVGSIMLQRHVRNSALQF